MKAMITVAQLLFLEIRMFLLRLRKNDDVYKPATKRYKNIIRRTTKEETVDDKEILKSMFKKFAVLQQQLLHSQLA
jgi:hypothetical protein